MLPKLEETIYVDFIISSSTGAAADADSTPTAAVYEDNNDTPILSPTVVKRTSLTGNYRCPVACTAANGFEEGKSYNVIGSATVGGIAAKAVLATFQIRTTYDSNITKILAVAPTLDANNVLNVSTKYISAAAYLAIAQSLRNYHKIWYVRIDGNDTTGDGSITAPYALPSKAASVAASYDLIDVGPGTFVQGSTRISLPTYCRLEGKGWGTIITTSAGVPSNTAIRASTGSTVANLKVENSAGATVYNLLWGAGENDTAYTHAYLENVWLVGDSDVLWTCVGSKTFVRNSVLESKWDITAGDGGDLIEFDRCVLRNTGGSTSGGSPSGIAHGVGGNIQTVTRLRDCILDVRNGGNSANTAVSGAAGNTVELTRTTIYTSNTGSATPLDIDNSGGGTVLLEDCIYDTAKVSGSVTVKSTALRPTISDRTLDVSTGHKAPATIAAGDIATDAIDAASVKTDAVTEIQNGLATSTALATAQTSLNAIAGYIDTEVAAIKAKTDQLTSFDFVTAGTRFLTMIELDGSEYRYTTNAVEQVVGTSAAALWNTLTSGLSTSGSIGKLLVDNVDAKISEIDAGGGSDEDIADAVWTNGDRTLSRASPTPIGTQQFSAERTVVKGNNYGSGGRSFNITVQSGADWPTDLSGYTWTFTADIHPDNTNEGETGFESIAGTVSVTTATGSGRALSVTITSTNTTKLALGLYKYSVRGTQSGGVAWTVEAGLINVIADPALP